MAPAEPTEAPSAEPAAAWASACERLRELGARLAAAGPTADDPDLLDRFEHLVDQLSLFFSWEVLHDDPRRPSFHRHNDLASQWGGPNADNVYRHARIDPALRYVVRGRMHSCDQFLAAIRAGFMHRPTWGTLAQVSASDLGLGPGSDIELHLGGDHPDAVEIPDGATMLSIREYYVDWTPEEPALFTIECLDDDGIVDRRTPDPAELAARIRRSVDQIEDSLSYWDDYLRDHRARRTDNSFAEDTVAPAKGLAVARYEFCFWDLEPDQALVVTCDEPDADYWSAQLYSLGEFEPLDLYGSITSRNHAQSEVSADGRVRFVLSADDPGVPNWLDTTGRAEGLCTLRW
ncbi:MAG: hypothetical protein AAGK32_10180 [Actinomycetota bacterium]